MRSKQTTGEMHRLTKKNWIELAVMTVIFVVAAILVYKTTILTRMLMPRMVTQVKAEDDFCYTLADGDRIEQSFVYPSDALLSAGMQISLQEDVLQSMIDSEEKNKPKDYGTLHLKVLDEAGVCRMSADYDVRILDDGQNLIASLPAAENGWKNKKVTLVLEAENINEGLGLSIGATVKHVEGANLTINGEKNDYTLNIRTADHQFLYWKKWAVFGAALLYLLLTGTYLGLAVYRMKPEKVFLFSGAVLAVLYMLLIPPMAVPDEEAHIKETYYYANILMGKDNAPDGGIRMDLEDFHALQIFETTPSLTEYDIIKTKIGKNQTEAGTIEVERHNTQAPVITYLPGIVGIVLGRLLGLNGLLVFYMGRICCILFYLFMMYWFIRLIPFGKAAAFIMAVLPMTIQQCCSYSYDAVVIEAAFLYLAMLLGFLYREEPVKKRQIVFYVICIIILSISKGGTYMPLCLLTMLIPADRFGGKKKKWIFTGAMAAVAAAAFLFSTLSYVLYVASPTAEQAADSYLAGEAYGLSGILTDPFGFIMISLRTFFLTGDGLIETMLGMQLGWLNIEVSRIVIYGMLLMMVLSILQTENVKEQKNIVVTAGQKISYLLVSAISVGMVFASMFMSWTPKNSTEIAGIQGRYFLPLLPILLLLFRNKNVIVRKDISAKLIFLAVSMQCIAIYGILMSLERIL